MSSLKKILAAALIAGSAAFTQTATASTIGIAVDAIGSLNGVGNKVVRPLLGPNPAIEYYIPLGTGDGTYGVGGFGTTSDTGAGGGILTMILAFTPVSLTGSSQLNILFEDLDLIGANDPWYFLESMQLFNADGSDLTDPITSISSSLVTGDHDTQQLLSLSLGVLDADPLFLSINFQSSSQYYGRNTPEYLIASISPVPLPAAAWMFLTALGSLGIASRRRKRTTAPA